MTSTTSTTPRPFPASLALLALALPLASAPLASPSATGQAERLQYRGEPLELGPDAPLVGEWIDDLAFVAPDGSEHRIAEVMGPRGLLVALRDTDCPLSKRYGPRLVELSSALAERGFGVLVVNTLSRESAEADREANAFGGAYAVDPEEKIPRALAARTTTEVFLLDAARTLRYRGMIDDQYGLGFAKPAPEREYLAQALEALEAGEAVAVPATQAQGCLFRFADDAGARPDTPVTWHERVGRIVQSRCQTCHRAGGIAPFALETLEQVRKKSGMIEYVVQDGVMPPWFAEEGSGPWANDISLSERDKADLLAWIAADMPEGDPAHAALPARWVEGWTIGEPDLVVPIPEPMEIPAEGVVQYRYVYVQLDLEQDRWVQAVEIRPGAREVTHHVLVFLEEPEVRAAARKGDAEAQRREQQGGEGYFASSAPGQTGLVFPPGYAKRLPAKAWLKFQLHYTPNGTATTDQSEIGFVFADEPVHTEVRTTSAINDQLAIPPKAFDHEVQATYRFPQDALILTLMPHTHLRGTRFLYELVAPDGSAEDLLLVPFYDFNWQFNYQLQNPRAVPAGTLLRATAWYDNSEYNPANPAPDEWVYFGEQTFEEMMIGYVNWVPIDGK